MKKQNTSNINTPAANQAPTSPSHSIEQTLAQGEAVELLPNYSRFTLASLSSKIINNSNKGANDCYSVFFRQNFRDDFYPLEDNNATAILNLGLRSHYNSL